MGNFFGDFSKGLSSGVDIGSQMLANQRQQEEFDHQKAEWQRVNEQRQALAAAGNTLDNPQDTNGLLTGQQYDAMSAPKGKKSNPAPAATGVQTPQAMPAPPAGAAVPGAPPPAPAPSQTALPPQAPPTPAGTPPPSTGDYVPVTINGQVMYAPAKRVKQLSGPDLVNARAAAIGQFDPVVGAQLQQSAQAIEKGNIELTTAKYGQDLMAAQRTAMVDPAKGLSMLRDAFSSLPGVGKSDFTVGKDGSITVNHYVTTSHGDQLFSSENVPAVDKTTGLSAVDTLFRRAQALATPEAYRQYVVDNADLASKVTDNLYKSAQTAMTEAQTAEVHPNAVSQRGLEGAQADYYGTEGRASAANTAYATGIDINAPFGSNVPAIMQAEGTAQAKGFDTILGDQPDGTNALGVKPPKAPTKMTLGEVYDFQRNVLLKKSGDLNSTAMGGLQITSQNVATYGPKLFGANWRNAKFDPANQVALGQAIHADQGYGAWAGLSQPHGGLPLSPKDQAAQDRTRQTQMATYVGQWMNQNNTAAPGTPEYTQNLMNAQTQAMQIYGGMGSSGAAVDFTTKPVPQQNGAPATQPPPRQGATAALPPPQQALSAAGRGAQSQAASTALEADIRQRTGNRGPLQMPNIEAQFQRDYGMTIQQARANPVAAIQAIRARQAAAQNSDRQREIRQRALLR